MCELCSKVYKAKKQPAHVDCCFRFAFSLLFHFSDAIDLGHVSRLFKLVAYAGEVLGLGTEAAAT